MLPQSGTHPWVTLFLALGCSRGLFGSSRVTRLRVFFPPEGSRSLRPEVTWVSHTGSELALKPEESWSLRPEVTSVPRMSCICPPLLHPKTSSCACVSLRREDTTQRDSLEPWSHDTSMTRDIPRVRGLQQTQHQGPIASRLFATVVFDYLAQPCIRVTEWETASSSSCSSESRVDVRLCAVMRTRAPSLEVVTGSPRRRRFLHTGVFIFCVYMHSNE